MVVLSFTDLLALPTFEIISANLDEANTGAIFGIVFIIVGLAFKVSAVPFHMWTPDVYEGSPTSVTSFFALVPKIAALSVFIRFMYVPFINVISQWQTIIIFLSIASMILGAVAAIGQFNIKRLMAYSSIGHMGYALAGHSCRNELRNSKHNNLFSYLFGHESWCVRLHFYDEERKYFL